jgi:uncharacterized membrane protein|nr:MAG TPA: hypothetical protein [Caudoviricetes sp.]
MRTLHLSHIIRFTLAIVVSAMAGFWIGSTVDDDYVAVPLALVSIAVIAAVILAPLETHSLPNKKEQD